MTGARGFADALRTVALVSIHHRAPKAVTVGYKKIPRQCSI